ncbi:TetR/AcrR family transcriptional regulator [Actinomadura vinacea]|uniref:TetR/AcrR family transcriptional regulator n=1 Tax=Actinomadura vinacea TaxID=115336 RepID=A0ABN3JSC9_9ACTN
MSPDPTRRSERSRQAILTATRELLFDVGYGNLTIEGIAHRAGVGKQTIYRWWPSKGAVMFESLVPADGPDAALPDTGDVEADLRTVLRAVVEQFNTPHLERMTRALAIEVHNDPVLGREMVERLLQPQLELTKERLRAAQRTGELAADLDLQVAVELLFGPVFHRWMLRTAPLTPEYADTVASMAVAAMRPQPARR